MNKVIFAGLLAVAIICTGCVSKVSGGTRVGMPLVKDTAEGRYERTVDQVFEAAKEVIRRNGTLANEGTTYSASNSVKTVIGHINQRTIYIRVEAIDPKITLVEVQARKKAGGASVELAHEVEKQIALQLVR